MKQAPETPVLSAAQQRTKEAISAQASVVRKARLSCVGLWRENPDVMQEVRKLLSLKFLDPDNTDRLFEGRVPGPQIKVRWQVLVPGPAGRPVFANLQRTWNRCLSLTGQQILDAVREHTAKKFPEGNIAPFQRLLVQSQSVPSDIFKGEEVVVVATAGSEDAAAAGAPTSKGSKQTTKQASATKDKQEKTVSTGDLAEVNPKAEYGLELRFPGPVFADCLLIKLRYWTPELDEVRAERAARRQAEYEEEQARAKANAEAKALKAKSKPKAGGGAGRGRARRGRRRG